MLTVQGQFPHVLEILKENMRHAPQVKTERWQGMDVSNNPAAVSYELRNVAIEVPMPPTVEEMKKYFAPNLPWAEDHFSERVGGEPINPGVEWANWPWGKSAAKFRDATERFNHNYMERLWPKWARATPDGKLPSASLNSPRRYPFEGETQAKPHRGIAWEYGDLWDLVCLLAHEPMTRQAYIPLFFPEDTGVGDGGRKPCTLGYQFLVRDGRLHIWYPLRSCDLVRHFQDDAYLAARLAYWVLTRCMPLNPDTWNTIELGTLAMHMTSLHVFENDKRTL